MTVEPAAPPTTRRADTPVTSLRASAYTIPTDAPEGDGTLTWDETTLVLVEARAGDHTGTGWTYAPPVAASYVNQVLAELVTGTDATAPAATYHQVSRAVRNAGRPGLVATAISAVDIALWDLAGHLHQQPLTQMWGGVVNPVAVYGSGGFTTYDDDQLTSQLEGWVELGLTRVKIKIGESWGRRQDRDLARTAQARRTVGDDIELFVDANGGYDVGSAVRMGRRLDDLGVTWFEEPVSSDDLAGLRQVREGVRADVAAGEYGYDLTYFSRMASAGAVDCLQVDVTRCGGYTEWRRVAAVAAATHVPLSGHCAPYAAASVAATTPGLRHLEWFHDHVRIEQQLFEGADDPVEECLVVPRRPGHGLTLRRRVLERWGTA